MTSYYTGPNLECWVCNKYLNYKESVHVWRTETNSTDSFYTGLSVHTECLGKPLPYGCGPKPQQDYEAALIFNLIITQDKGGT